MGESARQIEDAARMLRVRTRHLDQAYMDRWIQSLGLERQWAAVKRSAFPEETS
jgi:hypothetical protein